MKYIWKAGWAASMEVLAHMNGRNLLSVWAEHVLVVQNQLSTVLSLTTIKKIKKNN